MASIGDRVLSKYRLTRLLGEGGMGAVYEAEHEELGKKVAIKFLLPEVAKFESGAARFKREARAAAAIGHRSIVDIYDIGTLDDGSLCLVMEYLDGESLGHHLSHQGKLELQPAVYILAQVLSALHAAHQRGIVHRDVKPDNVFLVRTAQALPDIKLLDFGASQMVEASNPSDRLTKSGVMLGTPYYMAPEQARGETNLDHRIDLYAAGVILYEALTGTVPFKAENLLAQVSSILHDELVPPRELAPETPEGLEAVILKALDRSRDRRFADAAEMLRALVPFMDSTTRSRVSWPEGMADTTGSFAIPIVRGEPQAGTPTVLNWSGETVVTLSRAQGPRRRLGLVVGVSAAVVVLIGLVAALTLFNTPSSEGSSGSQPAAQTAAEVPGQSVDAGRAGPDSSPAREAGVAEVTVRLLEVPEGAEILLDGERVEGPQLRQPRSARSREVVVRLEGREWSARTTFEQDRELLVSLPAATPEPTKAPGKQPPTGKAQHAVAPPPVEPPPENPPTKGPPGGGTKSPQLQTNFTL